MKIDWNEAPEWAVAHALYTFVNQITPVWVGVDQWQDVVRGKPFPYGGGTGEARHNPTRKQFQYETPRPAPWSGEGLPPAGVWFEACNRGDGNWIKAKMLFVGDQLSLMFRADGNEIAFFRDEWEYRSISTPEQIAAEERELAITDICLVLDKDPNRPSLRVKAGVLYDAGYRKQVKP